MLLKLQYERYLNFTGALNFVHSPVIIRFYFVGDRMNYVSWELFGFILIGRASERFVEDRGSNAGPGHFSLFWK